MADARAAGGKAVVVTFDPHSIRVLRPEKAPRLLTSTAHKLRLIRALGIEHLLIIPFDLAFAATSLSWQTNASTLRRSGIFTQALPSFTRFTRRASALVLA